MEIGKHVSLPGSFLCMAFDTSVGQAMVPKTCLKKGCSIIPRKLHKLQVPHLSPLIPADEAQGAVIVQNVLSD